MPHSCVIDKIPVNRQILVCQLYVEPAVCLVLEHPPLERRHDSTFSMAMF